MDSSDTLKNFLKGIQKDDSPSKVNLVNLKKWEGQLKKLSHVAKPESFMKCVIKFIDFVVNYATSQSPQNQHSLCKDSFGILKEMITPQLKNIFVRQVTKRIFDIIIEENAASWCMKRELLKVFNHCVGSSDKIVRNKTVEEFSDMYIYKMVDSISSYGDYDLQVQLIETVFRMYGQITINSRLKDLIPESQELSQPFAEINDETFDDDIRTFLNNLNKTSGKLFSIVCESIKVGDIVCQPVTNSIDGLWVDFNMWESTITWYCSTNSFLEDTNNEDDEVVRNLVTLFVSDIETVNIHCSADNSSFIIYCKLSGPCLSSGDYQDILDKANNLSILVKSSQAANILITEVLPCLFGKKIQQTSHRDLRKKVSTMSEYKALNIKFKRRAKSISSRCKSDVTCTTSLFDPTSARSTTTKSEESALSKNHSMDQTSRSSNIEVITIDSSAEQRKHGARLLSTEQDERVPGNECSNDAISINSSGSGKSSNLAEALHIQIFSGRCSGSKMNFSRLSRDHVTTNTPAPDAAIEMYIYIRRPANFKVSTAGARDIENINPSHTISSKMECGNQKAAQSKKTKLSQAEQMEVLDLVSGKLSLSKSSVDSIEKILVVEIPEQKSIVANNNDQQVEVSEVTEELLNEKLPVNQSILESSEDDDIIPLKGSKLRKSILESSEEDDNIPLSEVRNNLSKKTNSGQEVSSLKQRLFKHEESPSVTMSNTGIVPALKGCEKNEELGYENIMKKVDELDKLELASLNDQNGNEEVYIPLEEQVNKISSTGRKVTDKSASSEDSCSDNVPIPDLSAPVVRIDPDKAFENLLRTSSVTNHAALKKVRVGLTRIASDSSGELLSMKTPSQETNMELKVTKDEELDKHIQEIFGHPDSPIKTTDAVESTNNIGLTEKTISSEEKVIELKTTLKSPIDPSCKENKEAVTEINVTKDAIEKDSPPLLEKNKKNVKFESVTPAKRSEEQEIFPNEMKDPNQTLSTTLSGRTVATDPVSPASFDISENSNKTLKVKKHGFMNCFLNGSDGPKKVVVSDELVPKETNNPIRKGVGKVNIGQSIDRDSGAVFTGIVPPKKRSEMPAFGIGLPKEEAKTKKPRKRTSKNEISYRDIKKVQDQDNKKRLKPVNLNTSIINSSGKSHLKSFFENMLVSFRDEMGGESILEKLNKNKVKETKPEKKSKRSTNRSNDTIDQTTTRNTFSSSPSLKLPKGFSQLGHKTLQKRAPIESHSPEENYNLPSDLTPDRNMRKRPKPFEDTPSVQKETEDHQTDGAGAGKINILSDIRIRPAWDDASPSPKKIKITEGPHLDNETIRENFSQERDLENADNTLSTQVSSYPILVSKHAPSWQGVALLDDKLVTLKSTDYLKKYLVLFFYPIDFGTLPYVCDPTEIISFNSRIEDFRSINVEIVACSVDSYFTHNDWVRHLKQEGLLDKLEIPLLSDANHHISKAYKIYSDHLGHTFRGVFIIDPNGIVVQEMKVGLLSRIDVDIFFNWLKSIQSPN